MIKRSLFIALIFYALPGIADNLQITGAWIKNLPMTVPVRAGYMNISNNQTQAVTIVSLQSNSFENIEVHQTIESEGMMSMRPVDTLLIPAGGTLQLTPGGFHLMMMMPLEELKPGQKVIVTLHYGDQKTQLIEMEVRK
jgi:copper(I)-binding protein